MFIIIIIIIAVVGCILYSVLGAARCRSAVRAGHKPTTKNESGLFCEYCGYPIGGDLLCFEAYPSCPKVPTYFEPSDEEPDSTSSQPNVASPNTTAQRLAKLEELKQSGVVTDAEYSTQRNKILSEL